MKNINVICYHEQTGYGNASVGLSQALKQEGLNVEPTLILPGDVKNGGVLIREELTSKPDAVIIHTVPEYYPHWVKKRGQAFPSVPIWGYTAWETDRLPAHWPELLNGLDGVFVPSSWNRQVLQASGVQVPIAVLPHVSEFQGRVPEAPPSQPLAAVLEQAAGHYMFYCISMWNERKNLPTLIQAFLEEFREEEKVTLLLKTDQRDWTSYRRSWRRLFLQRSFGSSGKSLKKLVGAHPSRNKLIHLTDSLSPADLAWIHHQGDCFVSCTRGEGWGMGAYEAAWFGNAVAMTSYGGQLDYLSSGDAYLIPYTLGPVETAYGRTSYSTEQKWANVDAADVRRILRTIYTNQDQSKEKGAFLRQKVSQAFADQRIANTCTEVLFDD